MINLLDTWSVEGNDFVTMYKELEEISNATKLLDIKSYELNIMTCKDINIDVNTISSINGYLHDEIGSLNKIIEISELMKSHGATIEILDETVNHTHMLFMVKNEYFFTTKKVLKTLCQRAGSTMGDFALRNEVDIRFHRDAGYIAYMKKVPSSCKVLYREINGAKKVFAVFGSRYRIIPQYALIKQIIESFEKEMGKASLLHYKIDNFDTEILLEFPQKMKDFQQVYSLPEDIIPGIRIHISDTGESSFIINGTLRMGNKIIYIPSARYSRAHTPMAEVIDIAETVGRKIFTEYTKIPEKFIELLQVDLTPQKVINLIPQIAKFCGLRENFGKKVSEDLTETLIQYVNKNLAYTAYDVVMLFLEAAYEMEEKLGKNKDMISKIRSVFIQSAFFF